MSLTLTWYAARYECIEDLSSKYVTSTFNRRIAKTWNMWNCQEWWFFEALPAVICMSISSEVLASSGNEGTCVCVKIHGRQGDYTCAVACRLCAMSRPIPIGRQHTLHDLCFQPPSRAYALSKRCPEEKTKNNWPSSACCVSHTRSGPTHREPQTMLQSAVDPKSLSGCPSLLRAPVPLETFSARFKPEALQRQTQRAHQHFVAPSPHGQQGVVLTDYTESPVRDDQELKETDTEFAGLPAHRSNRRCYGCCLEFVA